MSLFSWNIVKIIQTFLLGKRFVVFPHTHIRFPARKWRPKTFCTATYHLFKDSSWPRLDELDGKILRFTIFTLYIKWTGGKCWILYSSGSRYSLSVSHNIDTHTYYCLPGINTERHYTEQRLSVSTCESKTHKCTDSNVYMPLYKHTQYQTLCYKHTQYQTLHPCFFSVFPWKHSDGGTLAAPCIIRRRHQCECLKIIGVRMGYFTGGFGVSTGWGRSYKEGAPFLYVAVFFIFCTYNFVVPFKKNILVFLTYNFHALTYLQHTEVCTYIHACTHTHTHTHTHTTHMRTNSHTHTCAHTVSLLCWKA